MLFASNTDLMIKRPNKFFSRICCSQLLILYIKIWIDYRYLEEATHIRTSSLRKKFITFENEIGKRLLEYAKLGGKRRSAAVLICLCNYYDKAIHSYFPHSLATFWLLIEYTEQCFIIIPAFHCGFFFYLLKHSFCLCFARFNDGSTIVVYGRSTFSVFNLFNWI